jgi:hypothetical protein
MLLAAVASTLPLLALPACTAVRCLLQSGVSCAYAAVLMSASLVSVLHPL